MLFDVNFLWRLFPTIIEYSGVTLKISLFSFIFSMVIAIAIAVALAMEIPFLSPFLRVWVQVFRGTPLITQMFFIYFGLAQVIPFLRNMSGIAVAIMVLSFNSSAHMSESLRGAIHAIDKGQYEAGLAIGMSKYQTMQTVILPQALRDAIPALGNSVVEIIKGSAMAFTIGVKELMGAAQLEGATNYRYLETFTAVMIAYFVITSLFNKLQIKLEKSLTRRLGY